MLDIILSAISLIFTGFVTMKVWAWLVVPIFGLTALSFAQAIALRVFAWYLLPVPSILDSTAFEENESYVKLSTLRKKFARFFAWQLVSSIVLLCAWVLTFFV